MVGNRTRVKVVKNKVSPPFRQAEFDIMYGKGISREGSLIDMSVDLGIVKKSGAWFTYEGEQLGQGRENAKSFLTANPEIMVEISDRVLAAAGLRPTEEEPLSTPAATSAFSPADDQPDRARRMTVPARSARSARRRRRRRSRLLRVGLATLLPDRRRSRRPAGRPVGAGAGAVDPLERGAERERAGVADLGGDAADGGGRVAQEIGGEGEAPVRQVRHRRFADELVEPAGEHGP